MKAKTTTLPIGNSISHRLSPITYHYSRIAILPLALALCCFAPCSALQAVSPPPDGGYPGSNTAEGQNALQSLTSGMHNTVTGFNALFFNTAGSFNTATGSQALKTNTTGANNTA